ncbi:MAG TPA: HAMP domain-containing sensor histidine kinase [Longimicrobium sp.]|nr:HAMP domain-containing sensor histidine kinase [Longimicrobium sp.]
MAVVVSGYTLIAQRQRESMLRDALVRETEVLAWTVQVVVKNALRDRRFADLDRVLGEVVENPETLAGAVFDSRGNLVAGGADRSSACLPQIAREIRGLVAARRGWVHCDGAVHWIALPVRSSPETLLLARRATLMERDIRTSRIRHLVLALALAGTLGLVIHLVLLRLLTRPLGEVLRGVRRLEEAGPAVPLQIRGRSGELGHLARAFHSMAEQLEARRQSQLREFDERLALERRLKEAEKFAMLGRLSGGLAHELGSRLGVIEMRAESILAEPGASSGSRRQAREIMGEVDRIAQFVRALLHAGRRHGVAHSPVDLAEVARAVAAELRPRANAGGVRLDAPGPGARVLVEGDATLLRHVVFNLAVNAIQALSAHAGTRIIRIRLAQEGGRVHLVVEDTGPGIASEHVNQLFEPFFTTKPAGEGTGLGLAISRGIVEEHGGELRLELPVDGGVRAVIVMPAAGTSDNFRKAA